MKQEFVNSVETAERMIISVCIRERTQLIRSVVQVKRADYFKEKYL